MGPEPDQQVPDRRTDAKWRVLGWVIVAAAVGVAALIVVLLSGSSTHAVRAANPGATRRSSRSDFDYCARRHARFEGRRAYIGLTDPYVAANPALRDCAFGLMAAHHIGYFRSALSWSQVEPLPGQYDFSPYDRLITQLAEHHMRLLPGVISAPNWASTRHVRTSHRGFYPPANPSQYGAFLAACVERYGPAGSFWREHPELPYYPVRAWQIWNEPNLLQWWQPRPDPASYVRLLRAADSAIKRVDPRALVVTAGMPFFTVAKEESFLSQLFRAGMAGHFDALAIHSYSPLQAPRRLELARSLMNRFGAHSAQLWSTELAWASGPPDPWAINIRSQATAVRSFFGWVARNRARLGLDEVMWYSLQDHVYGPDPSWWGYHLGLLTLMRQPKPALAALSSAASQLNQ